MRHHCLPVALACVALTLPLGLAAGQSPAASPFSKNAGGSAAVIETGSGVVYDGVPLPGVELRIAGGNVALGSIPRGGLYLWGGVALKLRPAIEEGHLMDAFLDKHLMGETILPR